MDQNEIRFDQVLISEISGRFYVPDYQRGYRWGVEEVRMLLNDMLSLLSIPDERKRRYCLQPIVVKRRGNDYELVDGQQRLTTIYMIYNYISKKFDGMLPGPKYSIVYETRENSEEFLQNIDLSRETEYPDFWFMAQAYREISQWFSEQEKSSVYWQITQLFEKSVFIIWYEVGESEKVIELFERLNIGRIPLTSAELVKAMFLCRDNSGLTNAKQDEIALQWDSIERDLHDESFWGFLSDRPGKEYPTRIDLILNMMAGNDGRQREKYATFFYFDDRRKENSDMNKLWGDIQHTYLILKDWYENHKLYHKIGYLIASRAKTLLQIFELSKNKKKSEFVNALDEWIRESIWIKGNKNYAELSYSNDNDYDIISKVLLLFNVVSVQNIDKETQRFPFDLFKFGTKGDESWSLEHIHAQQSQMPNSQRVWKDWLQLHYDSVKTICGDNALLGRMQEAMREDVSLSGPVFEELQSEIIRQLSATGEQEYLHSISNLAMLNSGDNAALSNSTFDAKRNKIIQRDMEGKYIPYCTKMVFLKYGNPLVRPDQAQPLPNPEAAFSLPFSPPFPCGWVLLRPSPQSRHVWQNRREKSGTAFAAPLSNPLGLISRSQSSPLSAPRLHQCS